MSRKNSYITVTDQFCGAGGSSQGAKRVLDRIGGEIKLALNHWKLAIETHNTNFPDTLHDCTDISACDPRRYPSTDILITSPECDYHTDANGRPKPKKQIELFTDGKLDPAAERSRATMWDVCRFAEYHNYNHIIVENVWQARRWINFENWLRAMHTLGYRHKIVYFNSMFAWPTPQSRDRMYIHFWKKGNKAPNLNYTPLAHCPKCNKDVHAVQTWKNPNTKFGVYGARRGQYVYCCPNDGLIVNPYYYAAFNCIDWSDLGEPVLQRKRGELSPNTIRRINIGLDRFGDYPFSIKLEHKEAANVRSLGDVLATQTGTDSQGFVSMPFIVDGSFNVSVSRLTSALEQLPTQTGQLRTNVVFPFIVENKGQSTARKIDDALSTITGTLHHGVVSHENFKSFITYYNGGSDVNSFVTDPVGTLTGSDRAFLTSARKPSLEDCYYRSLKPGEVKLGMGFDSNYIVKGNSKEQVQQCGNAVTPPAMEWQVERAIQSLN